MDSGSLRFNRRLGLFGGVAMILALAVSCGRKSSVSRSPASIGARELDPALKSGPLKNVLCDAISGKNPGTLVGCYPFDGNSGDGSNSGNHGIVHGSVEFIKMGNGAVADFKGGYLRLPMHPAYPSENAPRTIAMWIYTEKESWKMDRHTIFHSGGFLEGARKTFAIDMHQAPQLQISIWDDDFFFDPKINLSGWFHLTTVYDPEARKIRTYVNGSFAGTKDDVRTLETMSGDYFIGSSKDGQMPFLGKMDDVLIFKKSMTDSEIRELYRIKAQQPGS